MELEEAVKYVAAAYGVILAVLVAYGAWSARRVRALERGVEALAAEIERRAAAGE